MLCAVFDSQDTEKHVNLKMMTEASPRRPSAKVAGDDEMHAEATWLTHKPLLEGSANHVRALELPWFVLFLTLNSPST